MVKDSIKNKMPNKDKIKISDLPNKSKLSGRCGFALANLHFELSVDFVPESNPVNMMIL